MTPLQKEEYEHRVREAISGTDLEIITISPDDDYIETWCPSCKTTSIFRERELAHVRCPKCYEKRRRERFHSKSEELVQAAGFELRYASYEDDYIEVECPVCEDITSFRFKDLKHIKCKFCTMKEIASENGFDLYWDADSYGEPWEEQLDEWKEENSDEPAVLVCRRCGEVHIISADANNAAEQIPQYKCSCASITDEIRELIAARGFSVELQDCPIGFYTLNPGEIALLCNRCGEEVILNMNDEDLEDKIASLSCQSDDCSLETDHVALTRQGKMAWCYDTLHVVSIIKLTTFNEFSFENGAHMAIPEEGDHEVYFAVDPSDHDYAFAFAVYPNEKDAWLSKYLLFRFEISTWGTSQVNVQVNARWPGYFDELYRLVKEDIADGENRDAAVTALNFDRYVEAYNSMHNLNNSIWSVARALSALEGLSDALGRMVNDPEFIKESKDRHLQSFIKLHTCPVCQKAYTSAETTCLRCGFQDLNKVFVNKDEAEYWRKHVLRPYKKAYDEKE